MSISLNRNRTIALLALLAAGLLLGVTTNLVKLAHQLAIPPLSYLTWAMGGAAGILLLVALCRGQLPRLTPRTIEYFVVSSLLTTVLANLIFFEAVPRLGVGFVAMMIALPPVLTYLGALLLRMERFSIWRASGVVLALLGTGWLVRQQWAAPDADTVWIGLVLLGPLMLALGNLYRSHRWPEGESAETLVPGMLIVGTALLILYAVVSDNPLAVSLSEAPVIRLIAIQGLVFAGQFILMFVVQQHGGPVFLSLMGAVSAIFAVPIAIGLLDEPALPGIMVSALLVAFGIVGVILGEKQPYPAKG